MQTKSENLTSKTKEYIELKTKLAEFSQLEAAHRSLEEEIAKLRGSVPKSPDVDILMIDLEKMCLGSGLDLVSLEEPDKEKLRHVEAAEEALVPQKMSVSTAGKALAPSKAQAAGDKGKASPAVETGLLKQFLLVNAQGSYAGCVELMRKLEAYQRVIEISQIEVGFTGEGREKKEADSGQLKISFLVTAYYLP